MDHNVFHLIDTFIQQDVLVIGEAMLDTYIKGVSERVCREAPVPVVDVTGREDVPGGAANTAVNVRSLGANVTFLSVVGDDPEGHLLSALLEKSGVRASQIIVDAKRRTLAKHRLLAGGQLLLRFDQGSTTPISSTIEDRLIHLLQRHFAQTSTLIISDYDYGILTPRVVEAIAAMQASNPHIIIADARQLHRYQQVGLTAVKPNYREALDLLGLEKAGPQEERAGQISRYGEQILEAARAQIAAVTLDEDGALVFERGRPVYRTYARRAPNHRAAGAGDTFVSALALALAGGADTAAAAEIASAAAAVVVEKPGTACCTQDELRSYFYEDEKIILDIFQVSARMASYHRQGRKIVFTNGCFDILHSGHVAYLNQAKSYGDILVVGINSDDSVSRLKGPSRPINSLADRVEVLAALSCVDHIIPFNTDTPMDLIQSILPDVFVKGGDYTLDTLPEAPLVMNLGGEVRILPYMDDHSTTGVIERIKRLYTGAG